MPGGKGVNNGLGAKQSSGFGKFSSYSSSVFLFYTVGGL